MKKLAVLSNTLVTYGGGERWLLETVSLLKDKLEIVILNPVSDIDIRRTTMVHIKKHYDISKVEIVDLRCKGKNTKLPGIGSFIRMTPDKQSKERIESVIRNCDVIYSVSANPSLLMLCVKLAKKYNKKIILGLHNPEFIRHVGKTDSLSRKTAINIYNKLQKKLMESIGDVHVQTESQVNKLLGMRYAGRMYYIWNYLYEDINLKSSKHRKKFVVLFVGRFVLKHKGIDFLEKIVERTLSIDSDVEFRIIGSGSEGMKILEGLEHKHPRNFIVLGFLSEKRLYSEYSNADLFILTSRYETPGLSLLEAQAHGLPAVAFDVPGPQDIIKRSFQGTLIEPFDTDEFAIAITNYHRYKIRDIKKFNILKASIHREIIKKYNKKIFVRNFMKMINN